MITIDIPTTDFSEHTFDDFFELFIDCGDFVYSLDIEDYIEEALSILNIPSSIAKDFDDIIQGDIYRSLRDAYRSSLESSACKILDSHIESCLDDAGLPYRFKDDSSYKEYIRIYCSELKLQKLWAEGEFGDITLEELEEDKEYILSDYISDHICKLDWDDFNSYGQHGDFYCWKDYLVDYAEAPNIIETAIKNRCKKIKAYIVNYVPLHKRAA